MQKLTYYIVFICLLGWNGQYVAQIGGQHVFQVLNFNNSARVEALGGYLLGIKDNDATLGQVNPALLNRTMHGQVNLNYINYFSDANFGYTSYTKHYSDIGTFNASLLYADYGKFEYAEINGDRSGQTFRSSDFCLSLGFGRPLSQKWSVGGKIQLMGSFMESYNSFGTALDFGANYSDTARGFGFGLLIKNVGVQWKSYTSGTRAPVPFNIAAGVSKRLAHAPFRFTLTYDNIQKWNLVYFDETETADIDPLTGEMIEIKPPGFLTKFMYHISVGTELLLSEHFHLRMGYNHMQRQTLKVGVKPGLTGFSLGVGFKVKTLNISYALAKYHIAGTSNQITISKKFGKTPPEDTFYRQFE